MPRDFMGNMDYMDWARRQRLEAATPPDPTAAAAKPIEQLWCLLCGMKTLVPLCWYLFAERHDCKGAYACYNCKGRTRRGFWYRPEPSVIHNEAGLGDKL